MPDPIHIAPPRAIQDAAKHGELVIFVGAGASRLCGSPDWRGFANSVVDVLEHSQAMTFLEAEQLRLISDPRRTISIALEIAKSKSIEIDFGSILHATKEANAEGLKLYELLAALRPVFVTTNYDKWLDPAKPDMSIIPSVATSSAETTQSPRPREPYFKLEQLTVDRLTERGAVVHLHGSHLDPDLMVVTLRQYTKHYSDARVKTFLRDMFRYYTVLFVGYGLAELEILEHIIRENESLGLPIAQSRLFLLYPHRSSEEVQLAFIENYFNKQCGIQVIPYCIDIRGYAEVIELFEAWTPRLDVRDANLADQQARIDGCVKDGAEPSQREAAVRFVQRTPELTSYFLNALRDPVWFADLDAAGFFDVRHNPGVEEIIEGTHKQFRALDWPALRYLEHISGQADVAMAERIMAMVRAVTIDGKTKSLDNWRTFWSLSTIFSRLSLSVIKIEDFDHVRTWLSSRFEGSMIGDEMGRLLSRLVQSIDPDDWKKAVPLVDVLTTLQKPTDSI